MSDTTHLLIPYAASASPGCQQAQQGLALPHLDRLLARLSPHSEYNDTGEETSFSAPHERALARALGLPAQDGRIPWAAWHRHQQGLPPHGEAWAFVTPCQWQVSTDHVTLRDPAHEGEVTELATANAQAIAQLLPGEFRVVLGVELARALGVGAGDVVTLIAPSGQVTPAGVVPRLKQMTVAGTFDSGHYEYDSALVLLHHQDAERIFRLEGPTGIRLKLKDLHQARAVAHQLAASLSGDLLIRDWTQQNKTWFAAVELEKRMMFIILTLIVAVAAFNLVSTLVMTVTDKRADIAILRTLGASPRSIMGIFVVQGAMVGVIGTLSGLLLGLAIAVNIDVIVPALESLLQANFLPKDIYLISKMPSDPQSSDIMPIAIISLVLSFLATLYPSWRASRVNPAEALRYE